MYHYTYRIANIKLSKHYYGVRSSKCLPNDDIGIKYFSSSTDKEFIKDQKENSSNFKYKVIKIFDTRKEALEHEILLHNKFDVAINESFYNRCKSSSTSFCLQGTRSGPTSEIVKRKISESLKGRKRSKDAVLKSAETLRGTKRSTETIEKIKASKKTKLKSQ